MNPNETAACPDSNDLEPRSDCREDIDPESLRKYFTLTEAEKLPGSGQTPAHSSVGREHGSAELARYVYRISVDPSSTTINSKATVEAAREPPDNVEGDARR